MKRIELIFDQISKEFCEMLEDDELRDKIRLKLKEFKLEEFEELDYDKVKSILLGTDAVAKRIKPKIVTLWYVLNFFGSEFIDNFDITDRPRDNAIDFIVRTDGVYLGQIKVLTRTTKKESLMKDIEEFLIKAKNKISTLDNVVYVNLLFLTTVEVSEELRKQAYQKFKELYASLESVRFNIIDINDIYDFIVGVEEGILNARIELRGCGGYCEAPMIEIENPEGMKITLKVYNVFLRAKELIEYYHLYSYRLFFPNIRSYLTLRSRVNKDIKRTAESQSERFVLYNNGIVLLTKKAEIFEKGKGEEVIVKLNGIGIVNGAQTIASTYEAFKNSLKNGKIRDDDRAIKVLIPTKIVEVSDEDEEIILDIARYSNSQNIIRPEDLFSVKGFHALLKLLFERFKILYEYKRGKALEDSQKYKVKIKRDDLLIALWYFYSPKFGLDTTLAHKKDKLIRKLMDENKDICDKLYKYEILKDLKMNMSDEVDKSKLEMTLNWFYFPYSLFYEVTKLQNKYSRRRSRKLTKVRGIRYLFVWLIGKRFHSDIAFKLPKRLEISENFARDFVNHIEERNILYRLDDLIEEIWNDNPDFKLYDNLLKLTNLNDLTNIKDDLSREKTQNFLKKTQELIYPVVDELINRYSVEFTEVEI